MDIIVQLGFNQYKLGEPSGGKRWNQLDDLLQNDSVHEDWIDDPCHTRAWIDYTYSTSYRV